MGVATADPNYLPLTAQQRELDRELENGEQVLPKIKQSKGIGGSHLSAGSARALNGSGAPGGQRPGRYLEKPRSGRAIFSHRQQQRRRRARLAIAVCALALIAIVLVWIFVLR